MMNLAQMEQIATDLSTLKEQVRALEERRLPASYAPTNTAYIDNEGNTVETIDITEINLSEGSIVTEGGELVYVEAKGEKKRKKISLKEGHLETKGGKLYWLDGAGAEHELGGSAPAPAIKFGESFKPIWKMASSETHVLVNSTKSAFYVIYAELFTRGEGGEAKLEVLGPEMVARLVALDEVIQGITLVVPAPPDANLELIAHLEKTGGVTVEEYSIWNLE